MKSYPSATQYDTAIQNPDKCFLDPALRAAQVTKTAHDLPQAWSGGFAYTYRLTDKNNRVWAVRCFHKAVPDRQLRYKAISAYLQQHTPPFLRTIEYLEDEILVDGKRYPITKMPWVEGVTLSAYIEQNYQNRATLAALAGNFRTTITDLAKAQLAHGDLSHDNLLVQAGNQLMLVDYDGMWVPTLSQLGKSSETGHKNFQHPKRTENDFGPDLDRFSALTIYLALYALIQQPALWQQFGTKSQGESAVDGLLFQRQDFVAPEQSPLLAALKRINGLQDAAVEFEKLCRGPLSLTPSLNDFIARVPALTKLAGEVYKPTVSPPAPPSKPIIPSPVTKPPLPPPARPVSPPRPVRTTPPTGSRWIGAGLTALMVVLVLFSGWALTNNLRTTPFTPDLPTQPTATQAVTLGGAVTPVSTPTLIAVASATPPSPRSPTTSPVPATPTRLPAATDTPTQRPTHTPRPKATATPTPAFTNTPTIGELQSMVKRRVNRSTVSKRYPEQAALFVDAVTAHLTEFQLPTLGVTEQTMRAALAQNDVGDRVHGLINEVWSDWRTLTTDLWNADPKSFPISPFRQLVIRLIQGRQGALVDSQQHALHNFFARQEDPAVWHNNVDGVIGAVNRESFQWSP